MPLTEQEQKLLRLALDQAAAIGEIQNAAQMLILSLRRRSATAEEFQEAGLGLVRSERGKPFARPAAATSTATPGQTKPDYGLTRWPWPRNREGPYKDKMFKEIPPDYLARQLRWIRADPERATKFKELASQIEKFLHQ